MARKLQSDKWLFLATLALVCVSVVMVYSASAVVALDRYQQPYYFVTRQVMWALLGLAVLSIVMRVDYRTYRNEQVVWAALGLVGGAARRGALLAADQRLAPLVRRRRLRRAAVGAGQGGGRPLHGHHPRPADGADQRRASTRCRRSRSSPAVSSALILLEPDFGTAAALLLVVGVMVLAAGLNYRYLVRR